MEGIPMALDASKETEGKLRWATYVPADDTKFELYIPKWRVPTPWPGTIFVRVALAPTSTPVSSRSQGGEQSRLEPIRVTVTPDRRHTRTFRYTPVGNPQEWEIGQPYIPYSLIPRGSANLIIEVEWDLSSRDDFVDVPTYRED